MSMFYFIDIWNEWILFMVIFIRRRVRDFIIVLKGIRIQLCVYVLVIMFIFYFCEYYRVWNLQFLLIFIVLVFMIKCGRQCLVSIDKWMVGEKFCVFKLCGQFWGFFKVLGLRIYFGDLGGLFICFYWNVNSFIKNEDKVSRERCVVFVLRKRRQEFLGGRVNGF